MAEHDPFPASGRTGPEFIGCLFCRHLDPQGLPRCAAYSLGIPLPILAGDLPHDRPLSGDQGIQFEPVDDPEAVLDELICAKAPASD